MATTFELIPAVMLTYVLVLEDNKYYVGKSSSLNIRIGSHWTGCGARWTRLHKPVCIKCVHVGDKEKELTLAMMREHGWENVRGHAWCKVDMNNPPKELMQK